jgi:hypothetical protein
MKNKHKSKGLAVGLTLMLLVMGSLSVATGVYSAPSRDFRMTGYLLPEEMHDADGAYVLRHEGRTWVFRVTHTSTEPNEPNISTGYAIRTSNGEEQIRLVGDREAIEQLNHPEMSCRAVTLHGTLYPSNNTLRLAEIRQIGDMKVPMSCMR